jgi:hypothetical protein
MYLHKFFSSFFGSFGLKYQQQPFNREVHLQVGTGLLGPFESGLLHGLFFIQRQFLLQRFLDVDLIFNHVKEVLILHKTTNRLLPCEIFLNIINLVLDLLTKSVCEPLRERPSLMR